MPTTKQILFLIWFLVSISAPAFAVYTVGYVNGVVDVADELKTFKPPCCNTGVSEPKPLSLSLLEQHGSSKK